MPLPTEMVEVDAPAQVGDAERVLIIALTGQDARLLAQALGEHGLSSQPVADMGRLAERIAESAPDGPGVVLLAEEALADSGLPRLIGALAAQPA